MGGTVTKEMIARQYASALLKHPSFDVPAFPQVVVSPKDFNTIVAWALEATARFISPSPKEDDEDAEFSCDDVVKTIRGELTQMLRSKRG